MWGMIGINQFFSENFEVYEVHMNALSFLRLLRFKVQQNIVATNRIKLLKIYNINEYCLKHMERKNVIHTLFVMSLDNIQVPSESTIMVITNVLLL